MWMGRRAAHHARRAQALPWWVRRLQIQSWSGQVCCPGPRSQPFPTHIHTPTPPTWARIWVSPATSTLLKANGPSASSVCTPPATCTPGARAPPCAPCCELLALAAAVPPALPCPVALLPPAWLAGNTAAPQPPRRRLPGHSPGAARPAAPGLAPPRPAAAAAPRRSRRPASPPPPRRPPPTGPAGATRAGRVGAGTELQCSSAGAGQLWHKLLPHAAPLLTAPSRRCQPTLLDEGGCRPLSMTAGAPGEVSHAAAPSVSESKWDRGCGEARTSIPLAAIRAAGVSSFCTTAGRSAKTSDFQSPPRSRIVIVSGGPFGETQYCGFREPSQQSGTGLGEHHRHPQAGALKQPLRELRHGGEEKDVAHQADGPPPWTLQAQA